MRVHEQILEWEREDRLKREREIAPQKLRQSLSEAHVLASSLYGIDSPAAQSILAAVEAVDEAQR